MYIFRSEYTAKFGSQWSQKMLLQHLPSSQNLSPWYQPEIVGGRQSYYILMEKNDKYKTRNVY